MLNKKENKYFFLDLIFLSLVALFPRLLLLITSQAGIESDEAIVGLMAIHISQGKDLPIFYYGQPYMGSLEAIIAAALFYLFGISNYALKAVPLIFSIIHVSVIYILCRRLGTRFAALLAGLYIALGPSPLIIWSLKARGGFIETIVIGALSLLITSSILKSKKSPLKNYLILSLVLGLGWWTNNQILFFIAPIGISILLYIFKDKKYSPIEVLQIIAFSVIAFILGGLPFWKYNLVERPKWQSFELLFGQTSGGSFFQFFYDYWATAFPIILGARKFWSDVEAYPNSTVIVYILIIGIFILSFRNESKDKENFNFSPFFIFILTTPLIFSLSSFGWLSKAPRYLLPLYAVLPIIIGKALSQENNKILAKITKLLVILIISHNMLSNYYGGDIANEDEPMVYRGDRVAKDHTELYKWLEERNCKHIHTNYWIGYRAAFETEERITFTRFGTPRSFRIREYEEVDKDVNNGQCGLTYVLVDSEVKSFKKWLSELGKEFKETKLGEYTLIHNVKYSYDKGERVNSGFKARVFIPPDNTSLTDLSKKAELVFDNSKETRWGSGTSQKPGMALEVDFEKAVTLGSINLDLGKFKHDAPSSLVVSAYISPTERVFLFDMRGTRVQSDIRDREFGDVEDVWDIRFKPVKTTKLRLELMEESPIYDWSIAELEFYTPNGLKAD